jgi:hypothetical protein
MKIAQRFIAGILARIRIQSAKRTAESAARFNGLPFLIYHLPSSELLGYFQIVRCADSEIRPLPTTVL